MTVRVAINGYGRIGRCALRALFESGRHDDLQVVAINEIADCKTIVHLTKYDSVHGRFCGEICGGQDRLSIDGHEIQILHQESLDKLPWQELDIDIVFECTGIHSNRSAGEQHIARGAKKVLFSQPASADVDATIVYGVNDNQLNSQQRIVSAASCTTNCSVPVIKALHDVLGVTSGVITTLHSAMNDQPVIDAYHHTDLRKTRSVLGSMIPVDTGLAKGIARVLPEMAGLFQAQAMRVPTANVSAIDLSVVVEQKTDVEEVNKILKSAALSRFNGVLGFTDEALASCDFNHDPRSGIVDASQTRVAGDHLVKTLIWFDNEWGYANRMLDVASVWSR